MLQSNLLHSFVVDLLFFAFTYNVVISVENPLNSWLWIILKELVAIGNDKFRRWYQKLEAVEFSQSNVRVTMCTSLIQLHAKETRSLHFSTSEEAEYPWQLTEKVVELVAKFLRYPVSFSQNTPKAVHMASGQKQHRRYRQLIPEFHSYITATEAPTQPSKLLDTRSKSGDASGRDTVPSRYGSFHSKQQFLEKSYTVEHPGILSSRWMI